VSKKKYVTSAAKRTIIRRVWLNIKRKSTVLLPSFISALFVAESTKGALIFG